jgi:hypothetical protein
MLVFWIENLQDILEMFRNWRCFGIGAIKKEVMMAMLGMSVVVRRLWGQKRQTANISEKY